MLPTSYLERRRGGGYLEMCYWNKKLMGVPIMWAWFKTEFLNRYFPPNTREAKGREFTNLVQGSMTVKEYAAKFIELSRFAPHLIPNEEKKARKFEEDLYP